MFAFTLPDRIAGASSWKSYSTFCQILIVRVSYKTDDLFVWPEGAMAFRTLIEHTSTVYWPQHAWVCE